MKTTALSRILRSYWVPVFLIAGAVFAYLRLRTAWNSPTAALSIAATAAWVQILAAVATVFVTWMYVRTTEAVLDVMRDTPKLIFDEFSGQVEVNGENSVLQFNCLAMNPSAQRFAILKLVSVKCGGIDAKKWMFREYDGRALVERRHVSIPPGDRTLNIMAVIALSENIESLPDEMACRIQLEEVSSHETYDIPVNLQLGKIIGGGLRWLAKLRKERPSTDIGTNAGK
jgi:hypothetical protein